MVRRESVPAPDAKIGKKIEFIVKALAPVLEPEGFQREGRTWHAARGEGAQRCHLILNLQGNKWNEGAEGAFYVNLSLYWPEVARLIARMPSCAWLLEWVEEVDEANGQVRERLQALLDDGHLARWPLLHGLREHGELRITAKTDLAALSAALAQAVRELALPWLLAGSPLQQLAARSQGWSTGSTHRIAAALLSGDRATAQTLVEGLQHPGHGREAQWEETVAWIETLGLQPVDRRPPGYA